MPIERQKECTLRYLGWPYQVTQQGSDDQKGKGEGSDFRIG